MVTQKFPESKRRKKSECCKNCGHLVVRIKLPALHTHDGDYNEVKKDPKVIMRETALALKVAHDTHRFYCTNGPQWKEVNEVTHFCSLFKKGGSICTLENIECNYGLTEIRVPESVCPLVHGVSQTITIRRQKVKDA